MDQIKFKLGIEKQLLQTYYISHPFRDLFDLVLVLVLVLDLDLDLDPDPDPDPDPDLDLVLDLVLILILDFATVLFFLATNPPIDINYSINTT